MQEHISVSSLPSSTECALDLQRSPLVLMKVNSKEGSAGRNVLMRQGEELTRGHGALGATFHCGRNPAVAGGAAKSGSGQLGGPVAVRRRRFPNRLSETLLQRWRWLECGSGDDRGALVLFYPQPPSESDAEERRALVGLVSLGLRGPRSSGARWWQVQPELWAGLSCPPAGQPKKWVGEQQMSVTSGLCPAQLGAASKLLPPELLQRLRSGCRLAWGCGQNWPLWLPQKLLTNTEARHQLAV